MPFAVRESALCIDHDHTTGKVRGMLCHDCNTSLGKFRDNPDILRKAADYLERPRRVQVAIASKPEVDWDA